jgi:hypothetical protein
VVRRLKGAITSFKLVRVGTDDLNSRPVLEAKERAVTNIEGIIAFERALKMQSAVPDTHQ